MPPNSGLHRDPLLSSLPTHQQKPTLAHTIPCCTLPSRQENLQPTFRRFTSSNDTNTHPHQVDSLQVPLQFVTQACTHSKYESLRKFLLETLLRQVYLFILLGLPALYSTHVAKIGGGAEISTPGTKSQGAPKHNNEMDKATPILPLYKDLKYTWEYFIDSLVREYQTFNLISVLLFSAVLAILQIENAAGDPLTRFSALLSLICALVSFLYGCIYIVRFGSMRKTQKVKEWVIEAQKTRASIFWNVWVLLAMPLIWLAWSILFFVIGILSFVWRTGTTAGDESPPIITARDILGPRIAITTIFGLGFTYSILIFTTFRRYFNAMRETQTTYTKNQFPRDTLPANRGEADRQPWPIHQPVPASRPRQHHLRPSYDTPEISYPPLPSTSTVSLKGPSCVNTPLGQHQTLDALHCKELERRVGKAARGEGSATSSSGESQGGAASSG